MNNHWFESRLSIEHLLLNVKRWYYNCVCLKKDCVFIIIIVVVPIQWTCERYNFLHPDICGKVLYYHYWYIFTLFVGKCNYFFYCCRRQIFLIYAIIMDNRILHKIFSRPAPQWNVYFPQHSILFVLIFNIFIITGLFHIVLYFYFDARYLLSDISIQGVKKLFIAKPINYYIVPNYFARILYKTVPFYWIRCFIFEWCNKNIL